MSNPIPSKPDTSSLTIFNSLKDCTDWLQQQNASSRSCNPETEKALQTFLMASGEHSILTFMQSVAEYVNCPLWHMPQIDEQQISKGGLSKAENGNLYPLPDNIEQYRQERLRLMAVVAIQKALRRKIVVNVGIGFIGTANITAAANALHEDGSPVYSVIAYQRPSLHSGWKVTVLNQGQATISSDDESLGQSIYEAHQRGNLTATFLQDQCIAVADIIFMETELHVRKFSHRAIERAEADPQASLQLIQSLAKIMSANALLVIESTVYPGFTYYDALPLCNHMLRQRGLLADDQDCNLAYGFHRVKPGKNFMQSFFHLQREAGAVTEQAAIELRAYFEATGICYVWQDDIVSVEITKDIENASKYGLLDLMSAFLKAAEVAGVNGFHIIRMIAQARPEEHGRFVDNIAGLQVGGYCVPKELGLLINGLQRHFQISELAIRQMFYSRIASATVSDYRAEDAVYLLIAALAEQQISINRAQLYWAGVSYKEGVGDTRMAGTERAVRFAAHLGADNRVTDPRVVNWPQMQQQRLGDPECWGHELNHQENLREIQVLPADALSEHLSPFDDAVILAVRHPSYVGASKAEAERQGLNAEGQMTTHPGTDAITLTAKIAALEGKILLDCFDFLDDQDIKEFISLGWQVKGFGKGHIQKIADRITLEEKIDCHEKLLPKLDKNTAAYLVVAAKLAYLRALQNKHPETEALQTTWQQLKHAHQRRHAKQTVKPDKTQQDLLQPFNKQVLNVQKNELFATIRQTGELLTALADFSANLKSPESMQQAAHMLQTFSYLKHAGLNNLQQDMDRLVHELLHPDTPQQIAKRLRQLRSRPELTISDQAVKHPLFDPSQAPHARLLPATVFITDANSGQLHKISDPSALPYRFSTKWVPDLAELLNDKTHFPVVWSKFSVEVPINLLKVAHKAINYELYEDFQYLPLEFRNWLIHDVWEKGYILTTLNGQPQNQIGYLMDVNLDPKTVARGRGGLLFWQDSRQPICLNTPQGYEIPLDIKAIGDYRGGDPKQLNINYDRTIISGRVQGGGTARTNLGQVPGHMYSADDINWQERCKSMGAYRQGLSPRSVFRAQWSYPEKPDETFQMVGRASPSTLRLGHIMAGTRQYDPTPEHCAYLLGKNNAEVLGHDIVAVHIAMNLDNVMSNGYYTDMGSNIDLFCERDPEGSFRDYSGYGILMVIYSYDQMKLFQEGRSDLPNAALQYLQPWFNGFLDHFLNLQDGKLISNPAPFQPFYRIAAQLANNGNDAEALIDDWLQILWQHYVAYHILRNRLARGYEPERETPYTTGREQRMHDTIDPQKALHFLQRQLDLLKTAQKTQQELQRPLCFNYELAIEEIANKLATLSSQSLNDYRFAYQLSFYQPLQEDVYTVLDKTTQHRLVIAKAQPSVFIDKMEANVNKRMRLGGLRFSKMLQKTASEAPSPIELVSAYASIWKGAPSHEPGEYDIQQLENAQELLALIQKDLQMVKTLNQFSDYDSLQWLKTEQLANVLHVYFSFNGKEYRFTLSENGVKQF